MDIIEEIFKESTERVDTRRPVTEVQPKVYTFQQTITKAEEDKNKQLLDFCTSIELVQESPLVPESIISFSTDGASGCICSAGSIFTITGQAKSRKTVFFNQLLRTAIEATATQQSFTCPLGFTFQPVPIEENQRMIYVIDTEHSAGVYSGIKTKLLMSTSLKPDVVADFKYTPSYLRFFCVQQNINIKYRPIDLLLAMEDGLIPAPHIIFIDGTYDFVDNINDMAEVKEFLFTLQRVLNKFSACAVVVCHANQMHKNAEVSDPGGHLGKHLSRKSDATILLAKDKYDDTYYKFLDARYIYFSGGIESSGFSQLVHDYSTGTLKLASEEERADKKVRVKDKEDYQNKEVLEYLVDNNKEGIYRRPLLKEMAIRLKKPLRSRELERIVDSLEEHGNITWLCKNKDTGYKTLKILNPIYNGQVSTV